MRIALFCFFHLLENTNKIRLLLKIVNQKSLFSVSQCDQTRDMIYLFHHRANKPHKKINVFIMDFSLSQSTTIPLSAFNMMTHPESE